MLPAHYSSIENAAEYIEFTILVETPLTQYQRQEIRIELDKLVAAVLRDDAENRAS